MLSFDMAKPPGRTHRYYTGTPQWPFGFGLAYAATSLRARPLVSGAIEATVANEDATRETDEVVFLFVVPAPGTLPTNVPAAALRRTLAAFERRGRIAPGASATLSFHPTPDMVRLHDAEGQPLLQQGAYDFIVSTGAAASEVRLRYECDASLCRPAQRAAA